jgi:ribosome-binding factor A
MALEIQHEISMMLFRDLKDRRIGFVTITGVEMSPDLRHAKVYVSAMGTEAEKKSSLEALNHAAGWIRHELGQRIRMKFLPEIVFRTDSSQAYGEHIDHLLAETKKAPDGE